MDDAPRFLTTREVADLLRVKERKVYDLAAEGGIPHRRITGKLLFPRTDLLAWLEGDGGAALPPVVTGSHDPLLDWALRESGAGLAVLTNGSAEGLAGFAARKAALAGLHLPDEDGWNLGAVAQAGLRNAVLIHWARRRRGLLVQADLADRIDGVAALKGRTVARRQPGAGSAVLLARLLAEAGLSEADLAPPGPIAHTEGDAAAAVADGHVDAALGLETMARRYGLGFVPLIEESFDLLVDRQAYFTPPVQALWAFGRGPRLAEKARDMGGYDLSDQGAVRWLSP